MPELTTTSADNPQASLRRHDLDWLRFIAILVLLFFHTGMWFNTWGWHVKNIETSASFNYWMIWLHQWRMPLLLFISGAGTFMAMGKRTPRQFAGERFKRLFIPLVFGMFIVVPPQIFYEHIKDYNGYWDFYKTVFQFVPYPKGSFSWHHLWFLVYLLLYSLLAIPLLVFLKSNRSEGFKNRIAKLFSHPAAILLLPFLFIVVTQILLRPYFEEDTHALLDDWALFTEYFCFFLFGMISYSSPSLWESIGNNRKSLAFFTALAILIFYGIYFHFYGIIHLPWSEDTVETSFDVMSLVVGWFTVITIVAWGQHYLNRPHPWLPIINRGLYPFYILHQTVIITIGYYVCQWDWSIAAKFWTISLLTLFSCIVFYVFLIRTNAIMRFLFGVKK